MMSSAEITTAKDAKTLTSQHILEVITNDHRLNFLREAAYKSCSMANASNGNGNGNSAEGSGLGSCTSSKGKDEQKNKCRESTKQSEEVRYHKNLSLYLR